MSGTKYDISSDLIKDQMKSIEQTKVEIQTENKKGSCPGYVVKNTDSKKGLVVIQGTHLNFKSLILKNGGVVKKEF
jgi:hypothetical protein